MIKLKKKLGFTLMELVLAGVIVGTLTVLALVRYTKTVNSGYADQAMQQAILLHGAETAYRAKNGVYWPNGSLVNDINLINSNLQLDLSDVQFTIACTATGGASWNCLLTKRTSPFSAITVTQDPITTFFGTHGEQGVGTPNPTCASGCP